MTLDNIYLEELAEAELENTTGGLVDPYTVAGALAAVFYAGFLVGQTIVAALK